MSDARTVTEHPAKAGAKGALKPARAAKPAFVSTRNACKLCSPLGACFAYRGIEGCIPLLHGSQGCSTYIRRYGISHFREPIDIASSNFTESAAIFGGGLNLETALDNVTSQYRPLAIGVASTCLSETIGEDVPMYLRQYRNARTEGLGEIAGDDMPPIFYASTPSYSGSHMEGFHEAVRAAVSSLVPASGGEGAVGPEGSGRINVLSGFVSTEDLRELRDILDSFHASYTLLPDYSETLDGVSWDEYRKLSEGGTPLADIRAMGNAARTIGLGEAVAKDRDAAVWLSENRGVPFDRVPLPIGIENSDRFFALLAETAGEPVSERWVRARGRLVDAYIDGHKYCSGKRAVVYGEDDLVAALVSMLSEIGVTTVVTGGPDEDFATMLESAREERPDFAMGNSKGWYLAKNLGIPLVRCGFPIHDRIGGQRILHLGYRGTLNLFELTCNAIMESKQSAAENGYTYI